MRVQQFDYMTLKAGQRWKAKRKGCQLKLMWAIEREGKVERGSRGEQWVVNRGQQIERKGCLLDFDSVLLVNKVNNNAFHHEVNLRGPDRSSSEEWLLAVFALKSFWCSVPFRCKTYCLKGEYFLSLSRCLLDSSFGYRSSWSCWTHHSWKNNLWRKCYILLAPLSFEGLSRSGNA